MSQRNREARRTGLRREKIHQVDPRLTVARVISRQRSAFLADLSLTCSNLRNDSMNVALMRGQLFEFGGISPASGVRHRTALSVFFFPCRHFEELLKMLIHPLALPSGTESHCCSFHRGIHAIRLRLFGERLDGLAPLHPGEQSIDSLVLQASR